MKEKQTEVRLPDTARPTLYHRIKKTLAVASQVIIAAPLKLPPKVVAVARYVALALGLLEAVEGGLTKTDKDAKEPE